MADKIRDFFRKKKADQKFKKAGKGHKMTEEPPKKSQNRISIFENRSQATSSHVRPTEGAKRAGEAAMARIQQQELQQNPNWSQFAIRAQARKEIDLEMKAKEKQQHGLVETVVCESSPVLAVSGIYFTCPLIGPDCLSYAELESKIKEFLYDQLSEERGLTSCLIIHTCNKDKEKVKLGVETLCKYLQNIIENPTEEKYQKIRISNRIFQERIASLEGCWDFLLGAGFQEEVIAKDGISENYLVFPKDKLEDLDILLSLIDALQSVEPIVPVLDRSVRVLLQTEATERFELPDGFFDLRIEELKREQEEREYRAELASQLRTKAMRDRDEVRERRRYRFTLIRIKLPDGIILQGTFYSSEKLSDVKEFIAEHLADPSADYILYAPGGKLLSCDNDTLFDLHLVPAAILNLSWTEEDTNAELCLKQETMALLQQI